MADRVIVIGAKELGSDLEKVEKLLENPELITKQLDRSMNRFSPYRTGHLKSSIYHKGNIAGAKADYAGWVELMGHKYAYATEAIEDFNVNKYADQIMEPL
jgi:hypothetical protein